MKTSPRGCSTSGSGGAFVRSLVAHPVPEQSSVADPAAALIRISCTPGSAGCYAGALSGRAGALIESEEIAPQPAVRCQRDIRDCAERVRNPDGVIVGLFDRQACQRHGCEGAI